MPPNEGVEKADFHWSFHHLYLDLIIDIARFSFVVQITQISVAVFVNTEIFILGNCNNLLHHLDPRFVLAPDKPYLLRI